MRTGDRDDAGRRVLVAAGRVDLVARIAYLFARVGYCLETAHTGADALAILDRWRCDLMILGSDFTDYPYLDVLRRALTTRDAQSEHEPPHRSIASLVVVERQPVCFSSSTSTAGATSQRIAALTAGADDVLTSPFHDEELRLRAEALVRRARAHVRPASADVLAFGPIRINNSAIEATIDNRQVSLTRNEFRILYELVRSPDAVASRRDLTTVLWSGAPAPSTRALVVHISRLRAKLEPGGIRIDAIAGERYRLAYGRVRKQTLVV